jgi:hypothetical protein
MYRKPKFLEVLHEIRQRMAREADYDIDLFTQRLRLGSVRPEPGVESFSLIADVKRPRKAAKKAKRER